MTKKFEIPEGDCILYWNLLQSAWKSDIFQDLEARKQAVGTEQRMHAIMEEIARAEAEQIDEAEGPT